MYWWNSGIHLDKWIPRVYYAQTEDLFQFEEKQNIWLSDIIVHEDHQECTIATAYFPALFTYDRYGYQITCKLKISSLSIWLMWVGVKTKRQHQSFKNCEVVNIEFLFIDIEIQVFPNEVPFQLFETKFRTISIDKIYMWGRLKKVRDLLSVKRSK